MYLTAEYLPRLHIVANCHSQHSFRFSFSPLALITITLVSVTLDINPYSSFTVY